MHVLQTDDLQVNYSNIHTRTVGQAQGNICNFLVRLGPESRGGPGGLHSQVIRILYVIVCIDYTLYTPSLQYRPMGIYRSTLCVDNVTTLDSLA